MLHVIKEKLYRINRYCAEDLFVEGTESEVFKYMADLEKSGSHVTSLNLIKLDGSTPKVAFRTNSVYKSFAK